MRLLLGITLVLATFAPLGLSGVFADSFNVAFNKDNFQTGETLVISGQIIDFGMPVIAMSIFDPDGKILSANNLDLSSDGSFSKSLVLESPFYEIPGEYLVKFDYGQLSEKHVFVIGDSVSPPETVSEETLVPEITSLLTEKDHYVDGDTIRIFGTVSILESPTVLIGVHDPYGTPAGFYFGNIDNNLEFSTSFLVKDGVNFKAEGIYSIKAHYAETNTEYFFEYSKEITSAKETTTQETTTQETTTQETTTQETTTQETTTQETTTAETSEETDNQKISSDKIKINEKSSDETKTKIIQKETQTKNNSEKILENKEHDNLSVEDIELGKLLNQINLQCDSSIFVDTISYYDGMGPALYRLCQFDSSLNFFNESLIENPDDVEILVNKGSALGKIGHVSEAIAYYDHALSIEPDYLPAINNKANALANLGNLDAAIILYNKVLEENPNYYTAIQNLNTAISLQPKIIQTPQQISIPESEVVSSSNEETLPEKIITIENNIENETNFFEEITRVFSSLFGFAE